MGKQGRQTVMGAVALSVAGICTKIIGMAYRIPLANIIGADGMGTFQMVFPIYTLLVTISTAGIPVAISVPVAKLVSRQDTQGLRSLLRSSLWAIGLVGLLGALLLWGTAGPLSRAMGDPLAEQGFQAMAPAVLFIFLMSVYRGFLQGTGYLMSTAVMQLVEQVARVAISLPCAIWGMRQGPATAAAYALLGTSVAEALTLLYAYVAYRRRVGKFLDSDAPAELRQGHGMPLREMLLSAGPIVAAAIMVPAINLLDAFTCVRLLQADGMPERLAVTQYGLYSGSVLTLINVLGAVALALAATLAPQVSTAHARQDKGQVSRLSALALRLSALIGFPAAVGMSLLARPLMAMFYPGFAAAEVDLAGQLLQVAAFQVIFFLAAQCAGAVLQGKGKVWTPFWALLVGIGLKVALAVLWMPQQTLGILGAPWSSLAAYAAIALVLILALRRQTGFHLHLWADYGKPLLATLGMAGALFLLYRCWPVPGTLRTLVMVMIGVLVYGCLLLVSGALRPEELSLFPGGEKLVQMLRRLRLLPTKDEVEE